MKRIEFILHLSSVGCTADSPARPLGWRPRHPSSSSWWTRYLNLSRIFPSTLMTLSHFHRTGRSIFITFLRLSRSWADKCCFGQRKVRLLRFVVSDTGFEMDNEKANSTDCWEKPRSVRQIFRFLGAANYYRPIYSSFSTISHPLDVVRKSKGQLKWTTEMDSAFDKIRAKASQDCFHRYLYDIAASNPELLLWCKTVHSRDRCFWLWSRSMDWSKGRKKLCQVSVIRFRVRNKFSATKKELLAIEWALH